MIRIMLIMSLALGAFALSGCGKKGDLEPPEGYVAPDYERAPEMEPGPMDEEEDDQ